MLLTLKMVSFFRKPLARFARIRRLQELAALTASLDMEEADQADVETLNYVLEQWVRLAGAPEVLQIRTATLNGNWNHSAAQVNFSRANICFWFMKRKGQRFLLDL